MGNTTNSFLAFGALSSASAIHISPRVATSGLTCGQKGWANTDSIFDAAASSTFTGCLAYCEDTPDCHSFTLTFSSADDNANCLLFSVPVAGSINVDDNSPWTFFDLGCQQPEQECGLTGYSRNDSYLGVDTADLATCAAECVKDKYRCASYAYDDDECLLYEQILADNLIEDSSSPYVFNDQRCTLPGSSSGTSCTQSSGTSTGRSNSVRTTATTTSRSAISTTKSIVTTTITKTTTSVPSSSFKTTTPTIKAATSTTKAATSSTSSTQAVCIPYH